MTIFVSQRANNDPAPVVAPDGFTRGGMENWPGEGVELDPRPWFTQTRDTHPWLIKIGAWRGSRVSHAVPDAEWHPRHRDFDPPVNSMLAEFRQSDRPASWWLGLGAEGLRFTPDEVDHARRVLTKLVALA